MNDRYQFLQLISLEIAKNCQCTTMLLALGSNHHAHEYLTYTLDQLVSLGELSISSAYTNSDYRMIHQQCYVPKYVNQCVLITLTKPQKIADLIKQFKTIEHDCLRDCHNKKLVTVDIDLLAVKIANNHHWHAISKRYPFKDHEWIGVNELFTSTDH